MGIFRNNKKNDVPINYNKLADGFFINHTEKKIIVDNNIIDFSKILDVKLVEDGIENTIGSKVQNTNLLVGTNTKLITKLDIEIRINDINNPFISVPFLKKGIHIGVEKKSKKYKESYLQAQKCLSILEIIIRENEQIK